MLNGAFYPTAAFCDGEVSRDADTFKGKVFNGFSVNQAFSTDYTALDDLPKEWIQNGLYNSSR